MVLVVVDVLHVLGPLLDSVSSFSLADDAVSISLKFFLARSQMADSGFVKDQSFRIEKHSKN